MFYRKLAVLTLALFLAPGFSSAADYKDWLPYLPDKLDGLKATSAGDGANLSGVMSTYARTYGSGEKKIEVTIMYYSAQTETETEEPVEETIMETPEMVVKTVKIQDFYATYSYTAFNDEAVIQIFPKGSATFMLTASGGGAKGDKHYLGLFKNIDLKKIVATF